MLLTLSTTIKFHPVLLDSGFPGLNDDSFEGLLDSIDNTSPNHPKPTGPGLNDPARFVYSDRSLSLVWSKTLFLKFFQQLLLLGTQVVWYVDFDDRVEIAGLFARSSGDPKAF